MNTEAKISPSLLAEVPPFPVVAVKTLQAISNERGPGSTATLRCCGFVDVQSGNPR